MVKKILICCLGLCFFLLGCNHVLSEEGEIAKKHLESLGYEIISFESESSIVITEVDLQNEFNKQIWAVQDTEGEDYLHQEMKTVEFKIKNHPLDNMFDRGKTNATVYILDNEVIGGWTFPDSEEPLIGGIYSLDGKTVEERKSE
jgi:hypothetical protein